LLKLSFAKLLKYSLLMKASRAVAGYFENKSALKHLELWRFAR
jgi:hypothetical protein